MSWLDQPPVVNLLAAKRLLQMLGALEGERLSAQGQKMAALGNDPRLAAMLVSAKNDDEAATAAKIAAILEEPPRMGNSDLGVAFSRNQPAWQQRSQQLLKRLNVRGGEADSSLIAPLLAGAFADRIARRRGQAPDRCIPIAVIPSANRKDRFVRSPVHFAPRRVLLVLWRLNAG